MTDSNIMSGTHASSYKLDFFLGTSDKEERMVGKVNVLCVNVWDPST